MFQGSVSLWAERLRLLGQQFTPVMARYGACNGWLDNQPAIVVNPFGSGFVYTVGTWLDAISQQILVNQILTNTMLKPFAAPAPVEVRSRMRSDGTVLYFVINHSCEPQVVALPWPATDYIGGQQFAQGNLSLYPYAVALLVKQV